jgi:hypothetical protein
MRKPTALNTSAELDCEREASIMLLVEASNLTEL